MMTQLLGALMALLVFGTVADSGGSTLQPAWRSLFDGKTTSGWRGYRQKTIPEGWQVVDGALTRSGKGGDIITVDQFADFELVLEWRVAPGANSGVFFRVTEDAEVIWHTAPEIQVIDNAYKGGLKPTQTAGSNYDLHAPSKDAARPPGEWNELRILANGNHVEQWLNGVKVVEYEIASEDWQRRVQASKFKEYPAYGRARRGHIGLQDHGDAVAYRNIRVREL
jgi:3-keto-disaccharide hydrolase